LRDFLLNLLEGRPFWPEPELTTCSRLADRVRAHAEFMQVAALYTGNTAFDLTKLVTELALSESVPYLPGQRYKESGLRKRRDWEAVWDLQRQEDRIDAEVATGPETPAEKQRLAKERKAKEIGPIPVPPKYASADFRETTYWRLRGKLDVPKERFVSFPGAERDTDPTPVLLWAGFDPLQQATALANFYQTMKDEARWPPPPPAPPPGRPPPTPPLAQTVAQRPRPRLQPAHGRLLRRLPHRTGPRPRGHPGAARGVGV